MPTFTPDDLVFITFAQDGKVNMFHLAHYAAFGKIHTSCGMVIMNSSSPTEATTKKPEDIPCCSSCATKVTAFSKKFYGGRKLGITKQKNRKKEIGQVGDEMTQALQTAHVEPRPPGTLF